VGPTTEKTRGEFLEGTGPTLRQSSTEGARREGGESPLVSPNPYLEPSFSSMRLNASSMRSSLSFDSALPLWIRRADMTTKEKS
jgi:hypothetical protein